jgi:tRNA pseudouridine38-40 synthase
VCEKGASGLANYRAIVAYDGTAYRGFQLQANQPTVQGHLERVLARLLQSPVRVHGAGRTDAGVHAQGQVISFRAAWNHSVEDLSRALNALLPRDVAVLGLTVAEEGFHARFSASSRVYLYSVYNDPQRAPLLERYAHHVGLPLDVAAMNRAAEHLPGRRDFAAFGQPPCGENSVRTVYRARWHSQVAPLGCVGTCEWPRLLQFEIEADAFLRGMVRRLVGTLLLVGQGTLTVEEFATVLAEKEISRAGVSAPACGLCLWRVYYQRTTAAVSPDMGGLA